VKKSELSNALDLECRINQFVYHRSFFAIDSVLKAFADYELTAQDLVQLRASASAYHSDFQSKFRWRALHSWCKTFAMDNVQAIELAKRDLRVPAHKLAFKQLMEPFLTKPIYEACWQLAVAICPWDLNITGSSDKSLPVYYLNTAFLTMARLMFNVIDSEEGLNRGLPETVGPQRDRNMRRETIREVYQNLNPRFGNVEREIFNFEDKTRSRSIAHVAALRKIDDILDQYLLNDGNPPPPPAGLMPPTPIKRFFPPRSDPSGSDNRGQKRGRSGGQSGQNTPHLIPHPSQRSSSRRGATAPGRSNLGVSDDDDQYIFVGGSGWQHGSDYRSQQRSQQDVSSYGQHWHVSSGQKHRGGVTSANWP
jgi:hypothetical protein